MRNLGLALKIKFFITILSITIIGFLSQAYALEIRVSEQATVQGDVICLDDIASFDLTDDDRVSQLRDIEISSSPSPGGDLTINKSLLMYKVSPFVGNDDDISMQVPDYILVHRTAQVISASRLEEIFTEHIIKSSPWPEEKLKIEKINTPGPLALPVGKLQWDIQENHHKNYLGNVVLTINFLIDEKPFRKISISGRISINQEVVKAVKRISRGRLISEDDLVLVTENSLKYHEDAVSSIEEAIGKISTRSIQPDQTILSSMIEIPPMVQKGNQVIIKAENEEIRITAMGKVLEDGRSGDRVRVMNINSGQEIFAIVKGPDLVEVYF